MIFTYEDIETHCMCYVFVGKYYEWDEVDLVVCACVYVGHFVLTHLLLDDLKKSAAAEDSDARIVIVSSSMHDIEFSKRRGREFFS